MHVYIYNMYLYAYVQVHMHAHTEAGLQFKQNIFVAALKLVKYVLFRSVI